MPTMLKTYGRQTSALVRGNEGDPVPLRALRDGTLSFASFVEALSLEGRVFSISTSKITAETEFGAGGISSTEPDLMVLAPENTTIILLDVVIQIEAYGPTSAIFEAMVAMGSGGAHGATTTPITSTNLNTGSSRPSACVCKAASSDDAVYHTSNVAELCRWGFAKAITTTTADDDSQLAPANFVWTAKECGYFPIIKGAGGFSVFAAGGASKGFISARYAEVPSEWFN